MTKFKVKDLVIMALMLTFLIVASKISFNIGVIPITLQTFAVFLISLMLGSIKASIVILIYILIGLLGLPVFSSGGGFEYIYSPSFGFIIGFFFSALVTGLAKNMNKVGIISCTVLGLLIINICGVTYMYIIFNYHLHTAKDILWILSVGVLPFILKDLIVVIIVQIIYMRLKNIINPTYELNTIK